MSDKNTVVDRVGTPVVYHGIDAEAVTPSDTEDIKTGILYVGVGGNVSIIPYEGKDAVLFKNVLDGSFLPIKVRRVMATNTTATDIVVVR